MPGRKSSIQLFAAAFALIGSAPVTAAGGSPGRAVTTGRLTAEAGQSVTIFQNRSFKVTGECVDNGGGDLTANTFLEARRNNLDYTAYSPATGVDKFNPDLDKSDGKIDFAGSDASGTMPAINEAEYYEFYAEGSNGMPLRGHVATSVHLHGADCGFGGEFVGPAKSGPARVVPRTNVKAGKSKTIYANADFRVVGTCVDNGGGDFHANVTLDAKRNHLTYYSTSLGVADTNFGKADGNVDLFEDAFEASGVAPAMLADSYYEDFYALGKGGTVLQGRVATAVHWKGADCAFSGTFIGPKSGEGLKVVNVKRAGAGKTVTLFKNDDFKVTGTCVDNGFGDLTADTQFKARRSHLAFSAYGGFVFTDLDFNPGDGPADITTEDATGTAPDFRSMDQYTDFWGEAPHGGALNGRVGTGVHMLGAPCIFTGIFAG